MKTCTVILLIFTLLTGTGCGKQEQAPKPPSMALQTAAALGEVKVIEQHIAEYEKWMG